MKKIVRHYTKSHELMEAPTHTIMNRHAYDNRNHGEDSSDDDDTNGLTLGLNSGDVFFSSFVEKGENDDDEEEDVHHHGHVDMSTERESHPHEVSMSELLLRVSTSVDGGHALPVSSLGTGSLTRTEVDKYEIKELRFDLTQSEYIPPRSIRS